MKPHVAELLRAGQKAYFDSLTGAQPAIALRQEHSCPVGDAPEVALTPDLHAVFQHVRHHATTVICRAAQQVNAKDLKDIMYLG